MGCAGSQAGAASPKSSALPEANGARRISLKECGGDLQRCCLSHPARFKRCHILSQKLEDDYFLEQDVLGTGICGDVKRAKNKISGKPFAVKRFDVKGATQEEVERALDEAEIYLALDHPHVVRLYDVYLSEESLSLVMECLSGGELFDRVVAKRRFTEAEAAAAVRQMLLAVAYLHHRGIAHCDLKLENFLYEESGSDFLKLCDFGFSQLCPENSALYKVVGTPKYMAPGVFQGCYTTTCDLWSLGVVTYILLMSSMPFKGDDELVRRSVINGQWDNTPKVWGKHSPEALDFVSGLLHLDPTQRLKAKDALAHPWLLTHAPSQPGLDVDVFGSLRGFARCSPLQRASFSAMAWALTPRERGQVRQAFMALNKSNSGLLDLAELREVLGQQFNASNEEVQAIFDALDMTCDGMVHYSDFLASMCISKRIPLKTENVKEVFVAFDFDQSGVITRGNLEQLAKVTPANSVMSQVVSCMAPEEAISEEQFAALLQSGVQQNMDECNIIMDDFATL